MKNLSYEIISCTNGDSDFIIDKLVEYNLSKVPAEQGVLFDKLDRKITEKNGNIFAGCIARMYCWNVVYIDTLWVDKNYRNLGLGTKLLKSIEIAAKAKDCYLIHLDTFDFQAKDFYEKNNYVVFGKLENCPQGHCRYYLKKNI